LCRKPFGDEIEQEIWEGEIPAEPNLIGKSWNRQIGKSGNGSEWRNGGE